MAWNWQHPEWPNFKYNPALLARAEQLYLHETGMVSGASMHLDRGDMESVTVGLLTGATVDNARIEGEILDRQSVQSSIRRGLGLKQGRFQATPAEAGMAEMTVNNFQTYAAPLDHRQLFAWHGMIIADRLDIDVVGRYRDHADPMQIVSVSGRRRRVHFEAPPSTSVKKEMSRLIRWFTKTMPDATSSPLPVLVRAGLAHLWFESIHPFEDGNGRIGRAVAEKALMQGLGKATVTALSTTLHKRRKEYYAALEKASTGLVIDEWLLFFAAAAIEAARYNFSQVEFVLAKTRLLDSLDGHLNPRQEKVLLRLFTAGPDGFVGGLSAANYAAISGAAPATVTRDLADLVAKGALTKSGEKKATRYHLAIHVKPVRTVTIADIA
ncbi:MAG: DUF4172 domain-containing protein [Planctomycetaceae bacterium]|nr:DUF4172 domain-containing protein [Planctomycetaceae bacterium]